MRIHHLNCGSLCPRGGRMFGAAGGPLAPAPMCCHCLLIESDDGLIMVDSGLGVEDVNERRRLGFLFNAMLRPQLDVAETALRQVVDLGHRPSEVRHIVPTHLDLDHAGGLSDFPAAAIHVYAPELRAASQRSTLGERNRYRKVQINSVKRWAAVEEEGGILVRLFVGARAARNPRRGAADPPARTFARTLRRRHPSGERLAPALRRRLFPSFRGRAACRRDAEGRALFRVACRFQRRRASRQSGAPARARGLRCGRGDAHLLARHVRLFRDEERPARSAGAPRPPSALQTLSAPQPIPQRDLRARG